MSFGSHNSGPSKPQDLKEEQPKKRQKHVEEEEEESDSESMPSAASFSQSMYRLGGFRTNNDEIVPGPSSAPTANEDDDGVLAPITYSYDFILVNPDLSFMEKARMILERMNAGFRKSKRWTPKYTTGTRGARTNDFVPPQRRVAASSSESMSSGSHVAIPIERPHWHTQIPLITIAV